MFRIVLASLLLSFALTACSNLPAAFTEPLPNAPSLATASAAPGAHIGQQVRWRGQLIATVEGDDVTWIEVLSSQSYTLSARFFVRLPGRLSEAEPMGRRLSVVGELIEPARQSFGNQRVEHPVIGVESETQLLWQLPAYDDSAHYGYRYYPRHPYLSAPPYPWPRYPWVPHCPCR